MYLDVVCVGKRAIPIIIAILQKKNESKLFCLDRGNVVANLFFPLWSSTMIKIPVLPT